MAKPNKHIDDLDYLAQLGFEAVPTSDSDINELSSKLRTHFGGLRSIINYFYALAIGLSIGITLFFTIFNRAVIYPSQTQITPSPSLMTETNTIQLDTISIINKPTNTISFKDKFVEMNETELLLSNTSAEALPSIETTSLNQTNETSIGQIKTTPNAGFIFLHDLKIANYHIYYFKSQQNIIFNGGLPANYSQKSDQATQTKKLDRNYYLHEAINDAMALFKKQKFADCMNLLQVINEYNSNDVNCQFYMGMCAYYLKNYNVAHENLRMAYSNSINVFQEEAHYYLALSGMALGQEVEANKMLLDIVNGNGFYSSKAKEQLKQ